MAVRAQDDPQYRMEIGAGVGVMTYEGDFNGNVLGDMQPAGFLVGRYNFDPYKDLKLSEKWKVQASPKFNLSFTLYFAPMPKGTLAVNTFFSLPFT